MIEIVNDFFEKDMFEKIKHHCTTKLHFEPQYFVGTTERNKQTHYGDRYFLEDDLELFKQFADTIEKKFKIKIIDHEYTEGELDIQGGFRENRAIFFPSNYVHSAHANNVPNLKRFSATVFIKKYEKVL